MKIRPNVKFLIRKYHDQISVWRADGPLVVSWEQICRELCSLEKLTGPDRPTGDGLRKAWANQFAKSQTSQNSETSQTIQTNHAVTIVAKPSAKIRETVERPGYVQTSQSSETTQKMQTIQTNQPETRIDSRFPPVPTDEEYKSWPVEDKKKWGKPDTRPDGSRIWIPLSSFEIQQIDVWERHRRCDDGEL